MSYDSRIGAEGETMGPVMSEYVGGTVHQQPECGEAATTLGVAGVVAPDLTDDQSAVDRNRI